MQHQLENALVQLKVKETGAELCSLYHKGNEIEYIWAGEPQFWARHSPLLFPVVGKLKEDFYQLNGKSYTLAQHGFARDLPWRLLGKTTNELRFQLEETPETLKTYPFRFQLNGVFQLEGQMVSITYTVKNCSKEPIPFSIGAHPGFNCPLTAQDNFEDYFLEFEKEENLSRLLLQKGLRTGKSQTILTNAKILPLSRELLEEDALVFKGVQSDWVALRSSAHPHGLKLTLKGFPYLGIWTKSKSSPFVCIEPWFGVADTLEGQPDIREKEGIRLLKPEEEFSCGYSIELF